MAQRVLIVDDEPNIVTSLRFLMRKAGYETHVARDGDEALAEVARLRPDLVLLDVMMPRRDGYEVLQQLREDDPAGPKVVLLTAKGREAEVTRGMALGADAYVTKPFSTAELVATVAGLLGGPGGDGPTDGPGADDGPGGADGPGGDGTAGVSGP